MLRIGMASIQRHPSYSSEHGFPMNGGQHIEEILEFEGEFYYSMASCSNVGYGELLKCTDSMLYVLTSNKIRLVKN
ncbi:TPA: hypothetical protein ACGUW2_004224 [Vibrio vulnificus]